MAAVSVRPKRLILWRGGLVSPTSQPILLDCCVVLSNRRTAMRACVFVLFCAVAGCRSDMLRGASLSSAPAVLEAKLASQQMKATQAAVGQLLPRVNAGGRLARCAVSRRGDASAPYAPTVFGGRQALIRLIALTPQCDPA